MNLRSVFLAGLALAMVPFSALAAPLPDLGGKKVAVVTENAYPVYARAFEQAMRRGVEAYAIRCHITPSGIAATTAIPIID